MNLKGKHPEKALQMRGAAYHQPTCAGAAECGGTFRCSACRFTYGWCVGHSGESEPGCLKNCNRCDRCCTLLAGGNVIEKMSTEEAVEHIVRILTVAKGPMMFSDIVARVDVRKSFHFKNERTFDRALQKLRKQGIVRYMTAKQDGPGWVLV